MWEGQTNSVSTQVALCVSQHEGMQPRLLQLDGATVWLTEVRDITGERKVFVIFLRIFLEDGGLWEVDIVPAGSWGTERGFVGVKVHASSWTNQKDIVD